MKASNVRLIIIVVLVTAVACNACKKSSSAATGTATTPVPDIYKKIYGATDMYVEGNCVVIKCNALPDHKSPYYKGTAWEATKYETYAAGGGTNPLWNQNPNTIASQNLTFKIPLSPTVATAHAATPLGSMGVSINGVPFFNQYAAGGSPLTGEVNSFDEYLGHPQMQGMYHYHEEPTFLTTSKGKSALMGFLLDGFPVYGPQEMNGATATGLDAYHGHTGVTADYPNGIYHYHANQTDPYINGSGFYGTPGTVSQ